MVSAADINPPANIISVSKALQPFIHTNHATGKAINHAINTSFAKSFESIVRILFTLAPEPARLIL